MSNCSNCKNAVFDRLWGDYKCKARDGITIYILLDEKECGYFAKGTPSISKEEYLVEDEEE